MIYFQGCRRFKCPHGIFTFFGSCLPFVYIITSFLPFPVFRNLVVLANILVKLSGDSAHHVLVSDIRLTQSSCSQPSEPFTRFDKNDRFTHPGRLDSGGYTGGCAAINNNIVTFCLLAKRGYNKKSENNVCQ
ncbi:hypothetical protein SDC9_104370 [bioreactor metagenome]|uniref:Uncharacterized protein n=1 Tax=bioreactor metagenome TaxID=1076179 RepID=A0A645AXQ8_9ZZZZ